MKGMTGIETRVTVFKQNWTKRHPTEELHVSSPLKNKFVASFALVVALTASETAQAETITLRCTGHELDNTLVIDLSAGTVVSKTQERGLKVGNVLVSDDRISFVVEYEDWLHRNYEIDRTAGSLTYNWRVAPGHTDGFYAPSGGGQCTKTPDKAF